MTTFNYVEKKDLPKELLNILIAANVLRNSTTTDDAFLMSNLIRNLHKYRLHFPQYDKAICQAIFRIHDIAYYSKSNVMRQQARNALFTGFVQNPPEDMSILKGVLDRMPLVPNFKEVMTPFQILGSHTLRTYKKQNYQEKDTNSQIAYRLKALLHMISDAARNRLDKQWVKDNAGILESTDSKFKGLSETFSVPRQKVNLPSPSVGLDAAVICERIPCARRGNFSHDYD